MIEYIKLRTSRLTAMIHQTRNTVTNSKMFYQKWKIIQIDWCMFRLFKEGNACIHQTKKTAITSNPEFINLASVLFNFCVGSKRIYE